MRSISPTAYKDFFSEMTCPFETSYNTLSARPFYWKKLPWRKLP